MLEIEDHPLLDTRVIWAHSDTPISRLNSPQVLMDGLSIQGPSPLSSSDDIRKQVREMLRCHGYKPSGRGKPASEYLRKVATAGLLPSINLAVDICNVVSLHSGLPISVIDVDKATRPFRIQVAKMDLRYVFNRSGQEMALMGLPCLFDSQGPCANAVKDSQRTKTDETTQNTLTVIWGLQGHPEQTIRARDWYLQLLGLSGFVVIPN